MSMATQRLDMGRAAWLFVMSGLLGAGTSSVYASDDWQLWLEEKWSVAFSSQVKLQGKVEERFRDDLSDFYSQIASVGISWKPLRWIKVEPAYYYQWTEKTNRDTTVENRLYLNLTPTASWGPLHVEDRNRIEFRHINGRDDWRYRNKPKLSLELGKGWYAVEPFVADEVFYGARAGEWNRNRFFVGIGKELGRLLEAEAYYMIESNKTGRDWNELHVLGLTVGWHF